MKSNRPKFPPQRSSYSVIALIPHLLLIAALIGGYYYIWNNNLFYLYLDKIYLGVKIIIACDIIIASISSTLAPILVLATGLGLLYLGQDYTFIFNSNAWQLIILSGIGFFMRILVR
jgi:hypothetical protein